MSETVTKSEYKELWKSVIKEYQKLKEENEKLQEDCEKFVYTLTRLVSHIDRFGWNEGKKRVYKSDDLTMLFEEAREVLFGNRKDGGADA